jgi:hypothetical protein
MLLTYSRYDLTSTFDVKVKAKIFTLHTTVFTERSEFLRAARKPEWLDNNPNKPVDLEDEDAEVFSTYVNCVYFGSEILQHYADDMASLSKSDLIERDEEVDAAFSALIRVYQIADKLRDLITANMVIDEIMKFEDALERIPGDETVALVYRYTPEQNPLRLLMRDYWFHDMQASSAGRMDDLPHDFFKDVSLEYFRIKARNMERTVREAFVKRAGSNVINDKCHYHQHDDKHPRCVPKPASVQGDDYDEDSSS